jgi:nifR3 family TIM-barrel protein
MAGVTNSAFRRLCREQAELGAPDVKPAGLFVCEMVTAAGLAAGVPGALARLKPDPGDRLRSVQLHGLDPALVAQAVTVCGRLGVDHVDLNFGCPVPKVTRKGGGGALPWKLDRLAAILEAAVTAGQRFELPVTVKTRLGLDDDHETFLDVARLAQETGVAAITLHARTVAQYYGGRADWSRIAQLVQIVTIPVLGNGDVWEAVDSVSMIRQTGCAGVVIGRGCLGRPWLFHDLARALGPAASGATGSGVDCAPEPTVGVPSWSGSDGALWSGTDGGRGPCSESTVGVSPSWSGTGGVQASGSMKAVAPGGPERCGPSLGEVVDLVRRHAQLLVEHFGDERHGLSDLRKHLAWYFKGFPVGGERRLALSSVSSLAELERLTADLDRDLPYPPAAQDAPRGRQGLPRAKLALPQGWLDSRTLDGPLEAVGGG